MCDLNVMCARSGQPALPIQLEQNAGEAFCGHATCPGPARYANYYCSHINAEARGFISTRVHLCRFDRTCLSNESAVSHSLMHSRRRVGQGLDVDGNIFSLFKTASPAKRWLKSLLACRTSLKA